MKDIKLTTEELQALIAEEIENMDEGIIGQGLSRLKARGAGALARLGGGGEEGQQRAKGASIVKTAALNNLKARDAFAADFTGLFGDVQEIPQDMQESFKTIKEKFSDLSYALGQLMQDMKIQR